MTMRGWVAGAALLLLVTTCCPTLWLTVTEGDPIPRFSAPLPVAAKVPIARPPLLTNRCDVTAGKPCEFAPDYRDDLDPRRDTIGQQVRALAAFLTELPRALGPDAGDPMQVAGPFSDCSDALVRCTDPAHHRGCESLVTFAPLGNDSVAVAIELGHRTIVKVIDSMGATEHDPSLGPASDGSFIRLGVDLAAGDVRDSMQVRVCASRSLALSKPLLTFVHLSDIQLRDGSVKLEDAELSRQLDWLIQSFEYDPDLQFYNPYVVESVFATINAEVAAPHPAAARRPSFAIHTGDSIDSGVMSELHMFHQLVHTLSIPLFEVLGNHDVLVFGNLLPSSTSDDRTCATVESVSGHHAWSALLPNRICVDQKVRSIGRYLSSDARLVASADHAATRRSFMTALHDEAYDPAPPSHGVATTAHGFDLHTTCDGSTDPACQRDYLGYYMFAQPIELADKTRAKAVFVALNTEDLAPLHGGTFGRIGSDQAHWLEHVIDCEREHYPRDLMFVFAHQPISLITVADELQPEKTTLDAILASSPNTVAYLYGHNHEHAICGDGARACKQFWEIETGSLIEFPQEARTVTLSQVSSRTGFLEVFTFGAHLDPAAGEYNRLVELGRRGAERDHCRTHPRVSCSDDLRPYRTDGRDTNARLFFHLPGDPPRAAVQPAQPAPLRASSCDNVKRWRGPDDVR